MARKKDRAPKPYEIAIGAILSLILGVAGAVVFLVLQPPEEVKEMPSPEERVFGRVYVVPGKLGTDEHNTWQAKEEAIKAKRSGTITVVEQELNRWAAARFGEEAERTAAVGPVQIEPGTPDFRIEGENLVVGLPTEWTVFGQSRELQAQATGVIEKDGGIFRFAHDRVYVGSCRVPGILANRLIRQLVSAFEVSEELREGWASVESAAIEEGKLTVVMP